MKETARTTITIISEMQGTMMMTAITTKATAIARKTGTGIQGISLQEDRGKTPGKTMMIIAAAAIITVTATETGTGIMITTEEATTGLPTETVVTTTVQKATIKEEVQVALGAQKATLAEDPITDAPIPRTGMISKEIPTETVEPTTADTITAVPNIPGLSMTVSMTISANSEAEEAEATVEEVPTTEETTGINHNSRNCRRTSSPAVSSIR